MKRLYILVALLCLATVELWAKSFSYRKDFKIYAGLNATLAFEKRELISISNGKRKVLEHYGEETEETLAWVKEEFPSIELVSVDDYNNDGYNDFGICVAIGYGGINTYRDYYFYDPQKKSFYKALKSVSNLEKKDGMLFTSEKSSQSWYFSSYKFKDHKPYLYTTGGNRYLLPVRVKQYDTNGKIVKTYWDPVNYRVDVPKLYLSKKVYIIEGDKVKLEAVDYEKMKVKIIYKGKKKSYSGWVSYEDIIGEEE